MSIGTNESAVIYVELGISATFLSNDKYQANLSAAASGLNAYLNNVFFNIPAQSDTAFAAATMSNLGLRADVIGQEAYDALLPAYAAYLNSVGVESRGVVVVQLASIVAGLTGDATFGTAATNLVNAANTAYAYSTDAANTTDKVVDVATVPPLVTYFTLTTGADALTGSALADIFTGVVSGLASANTLGATDKINGGDGADTLQVSMAKSFAGLPANAIQSIETIELTNAGSGAVDFDASGTSGVTTYTVNAANGVINLVDVATGLKTVNLNSLSRSTDGTTDFGVTFADGSAEQTATADAMTLNVNNVGTRAATSTLAARDVQVTLNSIETVNLGVSGSNFIKLAGTTKVLNVNGDGSLNLAAVPTALTTVDASAATGAVTANVSAATRIASVTTGSGADSITVSEANAAGNVTIAAGAGADKVTLTSDGGIIAYKMSGVETLDVTTVSGTLTFSGTNVSDLTTITTSSATAQEVKFVDMGAATLTFEAKGATADASSSTAADVSSDHTGATTVKYSASTTTAATKTGADAPLADYTFSKSAGALTVDVGAYTDTTGSVIVADKASSVTVNVASGLTSAGVETTEFDGVVTAGEAKTITVNAVGKINGTTAEINAAKATAATISNGANAADFKLTTPLLETLTVNSSHTVDLQGSNLGGLQSLTIDAGRGNVTLAGVALAKIESINLTGANTVSGRESSVTLNDLGAADNGYGLTLNATGLRGGLTVNAIKANQAGFDVNLNVAGVTGSVGLGSTAITAGKNFTLNAAGMGGTGGTLTFGGAVTVTGDAVINAAGAKAVSLTGALTANNVTVDISGTRDVSAYEQLITAKTSATIKLHELDDASANTVTASSTSTALTVDVTGGVGNNDVTVNGGAAQTAITLKGNLGAGTDAVVVSATASTVTTSGQTIDLSNLVGYESASVTGAGRGDTIVGGAGVDTIIGGLGADTLTGGAGNDMFLFNVNDSAWDTFDTIKDLSKTDKITLGWTSSEAVKAAVDGTSGAAKVDAFGVATFATVTSFSTSTLEGKVKAVNAATAANETVLFAHDGQTYFFADTGAADAGGVVIQLTGVTLPALTANALVVDGTTGLSGFGA